jgi:SAM-dependent methyltransferase
MSFVQEKAREPGGWEELWSKDIYPWDRGQAHQDLVDLVESGLLDTTIQGGRALVPGCGKGHDVYLFAGRGAQEAVGLDISATATGICQQEATLRGVANATFVAGDFFTAELGEAFSVVYDYTFFCAIDPALRADWGKRMQQLVKPGGVLVCLVFPLDETRTTGPPYPVTMDAYTQVLQGFQLELDQPCTHSFADRVGHERLTIWRRH